MPTLWRENNYNTEKNYHRTFCIFSRCGDFLISELSNIHFLFISSYSKQVRFMSKAFSHKIINFIQIISKTVALNFCESFINDTNKMYLRKIKQGIRCNSLVEHMKYIFKVMDLVLNVAEKKNCIEIKTKKYKVYIPY